MSKSISITKLTEATLNGINESMELYKKWSGGEWLCNAPEYLMTVKIAENIANCEGDKLITMEDNVNYILDLSNAIKQGRKPDALRKNGRIDIVIWNKNETPKIIIEVKNNVYRLNKIYKDINRTYNMLIRNKNNSTLEYGIIAFYISKHYKLGNAKEKLTKQLTKIIDDFKHQFDNINYNKKIGEIVELNDKKDAWVSVVLVLKA
jgi:hypothetical protein